MITEVAAAILSYNPAVDTDEQCDIVRRTSKYQLTLSNGMLCSLVVSEVATNKQMLNSRVGIVFVQNMAILASE